MTLPMCPEVCSDCRNGGHVFHVITELGDLVATPNSPGNPMLVAGCAEDEDFLVELIDVAYHAIHKAREPKHD